MGNASFITSFKMEGATVKSNLMALRHLPHTAYLQVEVTAFKNVTIDVRNEIFAPDVLRDVKQFYANVPSRYGYVPLMTSSGMSPSGKVQIAACNSFVFDELDAERPALIHQEVLLCEFLFQFSTFNCFSLIPRSLTSSKGHLHPYFPPASTTMLTVILHFLVICLKENYNDHWLSFKKTIVQGETYKFAMVGTMISTAHVDDPQNEAERLSLYAALEDKQRSVGLVQRHIAEWARLWESDILVSGNDQEQRDIRFAVYHLYSFAREGEAYSLSPMGLSGLGYNGHAFWDTEIWM
jgi:hypothetical protein